MDGTTPGGVAPAQRRWVVLLVCLVAVIVAGPAFGQTADDTPADTPATDEATDNQANGDETPADEGVLDDEASAEAAQELTIPKALLLGVVEGITEYLPVSSTGHLLVVQPLIGVGVTEETEKAADIYAIAIQAGAILAVAVLYFGKLVNMAKGAVGASTEGRQLLVAVLAAFVPAVVVALVFEDLIKDNLLGPWPVVVAWAGWGVVLIVTGPKLHQMAGTTVLEQITLRQALLIGVAQCIAMWPGTSRSLVTILAAILVGLSVKAAVEFSFLLGLLTLSAATGYEMLTGGAELFDTFGVVAPLVGLVAAFISAVIAVRWLVTYLQQHSLALFGWYRLAIAAVTVVLLVNGTIS
ncbi:MAG: undecaprenyl-diphosphate phosphatase [Acidimicrobiia bacterium]|nr:undecaprenyl-diphosphate phosphatase [Acidimicrobiia bacterium]